MARKKKISVRVSKKSQTKSTKKSNPYKCQICGKISKNSAEAITHLLDHGSSTLKGVSKLVKDQRQGRVSPEDRKKISEEETEKNT